MYASSGKESLKRLRAASRLSCLKRFCVRQSALSEMWPWMWHEACALGMLDLNNEHAKEILIWKLQSISNGDETSISMHGFRGGTHRYKAPYTVSVAVSPMATTECTMPRSTRTSTSTTSTSSQASGHQSVGHGEALPHPSRSDSCGGASFRPRDRGVLSHGCDDRVRLRPRDGATEACRRISSTLTPSSPENSSAATSPQA